MAKDTLREVNAYNVDAVNNVAFMPKEEPKKETFFADGGHVETKKSSDKLEEVNKFNQKKFNRKKNLFFIGGPSNISGALILANRAQNNGNFTITSSLPQFNTGYMSLINSGLPINTTIPQSGTPMEQIAAAKSTVDSIIKVGEGGLGFTKTPVDVPKTVQGITELQPAANAARKQQDSKSVTIKPSTTQAIGMAANALGSIQTGDPRGMWDTLDPVYHLAGGRESAVGNAMSDAGVSLTQAGLSSGQPYLALAGAALKVIGGLGNAAFGIKEDKEAKKRADESINTNKNFMSNAGYYDDIKGPASMTNTNVYEGGWFSQGKADDKNAALARQMADAYSWADRSVINNVRNISSDQLSDFLRNYSAFGGYLTRPKRRRKIKR